MKEGDDMSSWDSVSTLFSSLKTSGFSSINFSDYNSIKNGSYKKLLKSYYAEADTTAKKTSSTDKKKKADTTDKTGLTKMKQESDELKKSADALSDKDLWKTTNGSYDMDKVTKAVKSFADEYNNVIDQSKKVDNKDVTQYKNWMSNLTNTLSNSLSKVGVTVDKDGKLSVDADALKKADSKNVKALFNGSNSYAGQISQKAANISSAALRNSSIYSSNGTLSSSLQSTFTNWM